MAGLFIYYSNHLEKLSRHLAGLLARPSDSPLAPELIVVHSKGMGQWLATELAKWNGICANTAFPFPNTFLDRLLNTADPETSPVSVYEPKVMVLRIMRILGTSLQEEGFEAVRRYMGGDGPFKLYGLSEKIAGILDQYLIFRPDRIEKWEKGQESHWQAELWRRLIAETPERHRAARRKILFDKILASPEIFADIPPRVFLFGISYLPVFHLETLAALSKIRDIHLFSMNPCCEYWGDAVSSRERKKIVQERFSAGETEGNLHLETGNPLLSALGQMGRDFFNLILEMDGQVLELFEDIPEKSILSAIQADILYMRNRTARIPFAPSGSEEPGPMAGKGDSSIQIHSCHSPLREVEVLHDQLLAMFEADALLAPRDILIMAPDIESYAPFVHAVFGGQTEERMKIPYHIPDGSRLAESTMIQGFVSLLGMADSRFAVSEGMKILDIAGIKEKFGLREADLPVIEKWVSETGIRWGIDSGHRVSLGLPGMGENTWSAGFRRLLLGYAMPGKDRQTFSGVLPYDDIEGGDAEILGHFLNLFDALVQMTDELNRDKTLKDWTRFLKDMLGNFFQEADEPEADRQFLRELFDDLTVCGNLAGMDLKFGLPVIRYRMKKQMETVGSALSFISGKATFCTLLPFRSVPAKVVCLLGMNADAFPGTQYNPGFDLIAKHPRPGDRIKRNDDKYLFLQALMSAREKFYISFVGQSNRDNTRIPPCVIVQELMDTMEKGFGVPEEHVITRHRLQPFSEDYFTEGGRLFSYSAEDFSACLAAGDSEQNRKIPPAFIHEPLSTPDSDFLFVGIRNLAFFFNNPCKSLLETRLGITLEEDSLVMEEEEPFVLEGLNQYDLGQDLVRGLREGQGLEQLEVIQRAKGRLPHGALGGTVFHEAGREALSFLEKVTPHEAGGVAESLPVNLSLGDFVLSGEISPLYGDVHLYPVYAGLKPKYMIRAWVNHLVLNTLEGTGFSGTTLLVCKDSTLVFEPVKESAKILSSLLSYYWQGLMFPMTFFPETSFAYADALLNRKKPEEEALAGAMGKWKGNDFSPAPESGDAYFRMCFPRQALEQEIKKGAFQKAALEIYGPLLGHCKRQG